ncbi:MAG: response regulator [Lachnospiraceae bacterium]|nr:response regulator [Lachnospiraceae bacterium]
MDKKTVLIIDDVKFNIRAAQDMIGDSYKIIGALSAEAGMKVLSHTIPDLILLDIIMPEVDGHQVLETLKNTPEYKDIPVIFLTADNNFETEVQGFNEGVVDYITKPFVADVLKKRIQTQIKLAEYRKSLEKQVALMSRIINIISENNVSGLDPEISEELLELSARLKSELFEDE